MNSPPATPAPAAATPTDVERYQRLLAEARSLQGISLGRDAWRQLKRNWSAMASLYFLCIVALMAVLTPALPLQSPIVQDLIRRKDLPPRLTRSLLVFKLPTGAEITLTEAVKRYHAESERLQHEYNDARQKAVANKSKQPEASLAKLRAELENQRANHPFRKLWHNPGPVTRGMLNARLAIFGNWCVPSICGTDDLGRDLLSRILWGGRVSLIVGIVATFVSLVIGVTYGAVAGYVGGLLDAVMMRIVDILYSIPFIFVVIFLISILDDENLKRDYLQPLGINQIVIFYIVIGAIYWLTMARVVRGQVISLKNEQFIEAARTMGASTARIVFRHLIPNVMGIIIVYLTLTIPSVMLFEAFLSFLGLGVRPPDVSWGLLMNEGIKVITPIKVFWWLVVFPGVALTLTLFALNFLGDGLRDALDPRMKGKG
jgi:oligopeptide transport system permease protein